MARFVPPALPVAGGSVGQAALSGLSARTPCGMLKNAFHAPGQTPREQLFSC